MVIIIVIVIGLIVGSFLNAAIHRLHTGASIISGHSRCVHCNHVLSPADLVPVFSFFWLRGRCRYCHKPISWQYPMVELATALSFVLLIWNLESGIWNLEFWIQAIFISLLIVIAVYDFKHYLILDKIVFPAFALAVAWNIYQDIITHYSLLTTNSHFVLGLLGALLISGFFGLLYLVSRGRWIGLGDVKLGLFLGSLVGWPLSLVLLFIAYIAGGLVGSVLLLLKKKQLSSKLPFGTFLSFSGIMTLLYGEQILNWYLGLFVL